MTPLPTLTAATDDGRLLELVEQIERDERERDRAALAMNKHITLSQEYCWQAALAAHHDSRIDVARAELRAIIGVDPFRLANAIGA